MQQTPDWMLPFTNFPVPPYIFSNYLESATRNGVAPLRFIPPARTPESGTSENGRFPMNLSTFSDEKCAFFASEGFNGMDREIDKSPDNQHLFSPPNSFPRGGNLEMRSRPSEDYLEKFMKVDQTQNVLWRQLADRFQRTLAPNQCGVCNKVLSCRSALTMHYRVHTGRLMTDIFSSSISHFKIFFFNHLHFVSFRGTTLRLQNLFKTVFNKGKSEDTSWGELILHFGSKFALMFREENISKTRTCGCRVVNLISLISERNVLT